MISCPVVHSCIFIVLSAFDKIDKPALQSTSFVEDIVKKAFCQVSGTILFQCHLLLISSAQRSYGGISFFLKEQRHRCEVIVRVCLFGDDIKRKSMSGVQQGFSIF